MNGLLSLRVSADYRNKPGVLREVELTVAQGEIVGLIGESGSGKSTLALAMLRLLDEKGGSLHGEILFGGRDLLAVPEREMRKLRGREIALVLQSPMSSLNPALRVATQLAEAWRAHAHGDWRPAAVEALQDVGLPSDDVFLRRLPSQLSVGQAQRVLIAMAVLHRPQLLIADEATSALDLVTQSEVLRLFAELNRRLGVAILYISHDLLSVANLCHRIAILEGGSIVECGPAGQIFRFPAHPYTQRLIAAMPRNPYAETAPVDAPAGYGSEAPVRLR